MDESIINLNENPQFEDYESQQQYHKQSMLTPPPPPSPYFNANQRPPPGIRSLHTAQKHRMACYALRRCGRCAFKSILYTAGGIFIFFVLATIVLVYANDTMLNDLGRAFNQVESQEESDTIQLLLLQDQVQANTAKIDAMMEYFKSNGHPELLSDFKPPPSLIFQDYDDLLVSNENKDE